MRHTRKIGVVVLTLIMLMGLTTSLAFAQDPENGKVLWEETIWQCMACHGENGEGVWGKPLAGDEESAENWITQVRSPQNRMPIFSASLVSDDQIRDMHAYITSLDKPAKFGFQDAGLATNAHPGQVLLVEKRCVACHSTTGPVRNFARRDETPTAEAVITQLRTPRGNMPAFNEAQVSDEEAALIAEFLTSQISPQALPESGGASAFPFPAGLSLILLGGLLLSSGFILRRRKSSL